MPLQMIGTRRSGTNLLRVMIDQLPDAFAPQSTHELEYFMPLAPYYGDLTNDKIYLQFIDDMCKCIEHNPVEWPGINLERQAIFDLSKGRNILAIFEAIYTTAALQTGGGADWMSKCPNYINYFDEFENHFGESLKYIYMYRDGRDVALSFINAIAGEKHHYFIAKEWAKTQNMAMSIKNKISDARFFGVSYETLLANPEAACKATADFIGVPYTPDMLKFHNNKSAHAAAKSSALWENICKPLNNKNTKKYLTQSTNEEIHIFESVAGAELEMLGYKRHFADNLSFSKNDINEFERINNLRKQQMVNKTSPEDVRRREKQKAVADSTRTRLNCEHVKYHGNMIHKTKTEDVVEV